MLTFIIKQLQTIEKSTCLHLRLCCSSMAFSKGALSLLADYGDNASDDEVPGPRVSTKRSYKDDEDEEPHKRQINKLPVPDAINKIFNNTLEIHKDDPTIHEGRQRSFAHERGNWATYIYVPYESNNELEEILSYIKNCTRNIDLKNVDHYHISVTKTVILRHHWIDLFVQTVREKLSSIRRFMIIFDSFKVYCNEERSRTFLGMQIKTGFDSLKMIVQHLDHCLDEFKLEHFYKDPSFHMSILWCLGDKQEQLSIMLPQLNEAIFNQSENIMQENRYIYVQTLQCKTGNKLFTFELS